MELLKLEMDLCPVHPMHRRVLGAPRLREIALRLRESVPPVAGTLDASRSRMAAIFALILVPAIAAVGFMVLSNGELSFGVSMATLCFAMLASGIFLGLLRLARQWEDETPPDRESVRCGRPAQLNCAAPTSGGERHNAVDRGSERAGSLELQPTAKWQHWSTDCVAQEAPRTACRPRLDLLHPVMISSLTSPRRAVFELIERTHFTRSILKSSYNERMNGVSLFESITWQPRLTSCFAVSES